MPPPPLPSVSLPFAVPRSAHALQPPLSAALASPAKIARQSPRARSRRSRGNRARRARSPSSGAYAAIAARSSPRSPDCRRADRSRVWKSTSSAINRDSGVFLSIARPARSAASSRARPARVRPGAPGREPRRKRVDRAAHFVELADAPGIELGDLKTAAAALGHQALPVQQMQRMGDRLARHAELLRELVLARCAGPAAGCGR